MTVPKPVQPLSFLFYGHPWYNFMNATVVQGLQELGHTVYGATGDGTANYCEQWKGQPYDVLIQAWDKGEVPPSWSPSIPKIYLFGEDVPPDKDPCDFIPFADLKADAYFVRDFKGHPAENIFPMNFGVERRYYSSTQFGVTPLKQRHYDIVFFGRWQTSPVRAALLSEIKKRLTAQNYVVRFEENVFQTPAKEWVKWVNGYCVHDRMYYDALANSKIVLSPHGAGPDCGRNWEAFASGGIPLIQRMNTQIVPPGLTQGSDCLLFDTADDAVELVIKTLSNPQFAQALADHAFNVAAPAHSTKARAEYLLDRIRRLGLV